MSGEFAAGSARRMMWQHARTSQRARRTTPVKRGQPIGGLKGGKT
jgi:hypothetical protein